MSFETAVAARLLADSDIGSIVTTRVYWQLRPQGSALPAIELSIVTDSRPQNYKRIERRRWTRVQAVAVATDAGTAVALREAVIAALLPPAEAGGVSFGRAQDIFVLPRLNTGAPGTDTEFREIVDLRLWHDA